MGVLCVSNRQWLSDTLISDSAIITLADDYRNYYSQTMLQPNNIAEPLADEFDVVGIGSTTFTMWRRLLGSNQRPPACEA